MDHQAQEELMKVISKVITKFGENVSTLESRSSLTENASNIYNMDNNAEIIIELSDENQQLKERIEEYINEVKELKEKGKNLEAELSEKKK